MRLLGLIAAACVLVACGDDPEAPTASTAPATTASTLPPLGENPTVQQCRDAQDVYLGALKVPDDVNPSDGLNQAERAAVIDMNADAKRRAGIDPDAMSPCLTVLPTEELIADMKRLPPEVEELVGLLVGLEPES